MQIAFTHPTGSIELLRAFAELGKLETSREYDALFSVPHAGDGTVAEDAVRLIARQARQFLEMHGDELGEHTRCLLTRLERAEGGSYLTPSAAARVAYDDTKTTDERRHELGELLAAGSADEGEVAGYMEMLAMLDHAAGWGTHRRGLGAERD